MTPSAVTDGLDARPVASSGTASIKAQGSGTEALDFPLGSSGSDLKSMAEGSKNDVDQLQDLLGMSGVDLRAEEEAIHGPASAQSGMASAAAAMGGVSARHHDADIQPTQFYLELYALSHRIHSIAERNGLGVDPDVLALLSNAAKMRSRNLLESMVAASRHRQWSSHLREPPKRSSSGQAMYHEDVYDDPQKLLGALARVEKAEEQDARQVRMQRDAQDEQAIDVDSTNAHTRIADVAAAASVESTTQEEAKRKAKRPGGASAAARNMTEDKRLKLANKTAAQALGISTGSKAWMFGGGSGGGGDSLSGSSSSAKESRLKTPSRLPKPRFAPPTASTANEARSSLNNSSGKVAVDSVAARSGMADGGGEDETGEEVSSIINPGGWGDLAARQRHKEEEERKRTRRVNLEDALHALDMERKGGAGRGGGDRVLYTARALGRPTLPSTSGLTSIG